jgi:hypothetical protein
MSSTATIQLLEPIQGLEFNEEKHRYKYNGKWVTSSPTGILSHDMDPYVKKRIEQTRGQWEPRGRTLHACLEQYLLGAAELDPGDYADWWEPLKQCWLWKDATVMGVELRLVDPKGSIAGSTDFLIRTAKGSVVLGDLKTCSSMSAAKMRKGADEQLGAYLSMLNANYPDVVVDKCVTVISGPKVCTVLSAEPDECFKKWEAALERYQASRDLMGF